MNIITEEKLEHYFDLTRRALSAVAIAVDASHPQYRHAVDFLDMAHRYFSDAQHFRTKGDVVSAFAAVNYAHAWLDAGARMKLFSTGGDDGTLFAAD